MHISSRRNIEMWIEIILVVVLAVASGTDAFVSSYKKIGQSPFSNPASLISTYRSKTPSRFELPQSLNDSPQPVGTADQSDSKFFPSSTSNNTFRDFMIKLWSQNLFRRWVTGITLGIIGTLWISSGNGIFSLGFLFTSLIAQNEYFTMVRATGVLPASKTGTIACLVSYLTAAMIPEYHELVMPLSATLLMIWLLLFNKKVASINEISTSLLGMFYIGYLPSFWVRLRALDDLTKIRFSASLSKYLSQRWFDPQAWTVGAIVTWWTWCSIVCADVGAYFIGKNFGKHKLSTFSSAAGAASPKKTIEGALGGLVACTLFSVLGAYVMQWPLWIATGTLYGIMLSVISLVGDLTASMMKRDAKMKDSGSLLPGHGGVLDRIDSYMFTAPAAFFFCRDVLPFALKLAVKFKM